MKKKSEKQSKKRIVFIVSAELIPYEVIQYLESFHVKVWPKQVNWNDDRSRTCSIDVTEKQFIWSARLIAGYSDQIKVIEPKNIKPVKPKSRWQEGSVKTKGFKPFLLRSIGDILFPLRPVKLPGIKKK